MISRCWPNLIIPGAGRSGKMALCEYLNRHQDVFLPNPIEPNFFSYYKVNINYNSKDELFYNNIITNKEGYNSIFNNGINSNIRIDASGSYLLFSDKTINEISTMIPDYKKIKIIIMLRNPIDRALSAFTHYTMHKFESLPMQKAINTTTITERLNNHWSPNYDYISGSMYFYNVKNYLKNFNDVKIVLSTDLKNNTVNTLKSIYEFLELPCEIPINIQSNINTSGIVKSQILNDILFDGSNIFRRIAQPIVKQFINVDKRTELKNKLRSKNLREPQKITYELRKNLVSNFKKDIKELEGIIQRDLSHWL
jgi:hypothetical protein